MKLMQIVCDSKYINVKEKKEEDWKTSKIGSFDLILFGTFLHTLDAQRLSGVHVKTT